MSSSPLSEAELAPLNESLPNWRRAGDSLVQGFKLADFSAAWAFMSRVALLAEKQDHHPNWSNSYNLVQISLSTHDAGGVTAKDIALARAIDELSAP